MLEFLDNHLIIQTLSIIIIIVISYAILRYKLDGGEEIYMFTNEELNEMKKRGETIPDEYIIIETISFGKIGEGIVKGVKKIVKKKEKKTDNKKKTNSEK